MLNKVLLPLISALLMASSLVFARGPGTIDTELTADETEDLRYMREEEKLARDMYLTFYEKWNAVLFATIAGSEQRHMDAMLKQLLRFGIPDPAAGNAIGEFTNPDLQVLYDKLAAKGLKRRLKAFKVGGFIEETDIRDLAAAIDRSSVDQIDSVYGNLLCGSRNHLRAFAQRIEALTGKPYVAQVISQAEVESVLDSPSEICGR